jgi:hypothetical protein
MTPSPDATVDRSLVAPAGPALLMVGGSGSVCVDGVCIIDPLEVQQQQGSGKAS